MSVPPVTHGKVGQIVEQLRMAGLSLGSGPVQIVIIAMPLHRSLDQYFSEKKTLCIDYP